MSVLTNTPSIALRQLLLLRPSFLSPTLQRRRLTPLPPSSTTHPAQRTFTTSSSPAPQSQTRSAIITGSSRGIGRAIALRLAGDGFNICIHDHPSNEAQCQTTLAEIKNIQSQLGSGSRQDTASNNKKACYALGDISKRDQVEDIIATSVRELGDLDVMVANAGIAQVVPALEVSEADLRRMFEVNVFGLVNCYIASAKQMIAQQAKARPSDTSVTEQQREGGGKSRQIKGKIIGAASIAAFKPTALLSHYTASKFAVRGLTQSYALELAEHNITVNAYAPGIVGTQMWDLIDSEMAKQKGMKRGEVLEKMVKDNTALGRVSVAEDVSALVSFLASEDSDFITGQTQIVDGGIVYT